MQKSNFVLPKCLLALTVFLAACGGGGGDASPIGPGLGGNPNGGGSTTQAILNQGLVGKLFMTSPNAYIEFDLQTGVSRILREKTGEMSASADGQELALVNRRPPDTTVFDRLEEVVFFGRDGRQSARFLKEEGFGGRPLISPDKQHVLVEWHSIDLGDDGGVSVPTVFRRDGSILKRFTGYGGYAWLPDGRILLTRNDAIFVTSLSANSPSLLRRFPGDTPLFVTPSPDGTRISFTLGDAGVLKNHTFIMNIDGTGLRQVSTSDTNDAPADFSPDGNSLLIGQGSNFAIIGPGFAAAGCAELYVVPLNITSVVNLTSANPAPALKLKRIEEDTGEIQQKVCGFSSPTWRNLPSLESPNMGTLFASSGLNRGLTGLTFYGFASRLYRTDLSTGETRILNEQAPNSPFPALDASEVIFYDRSERSALQRLQAVKFLSSNGLQQRVIDVPEGFSGVLKYSPDKSKVAVDWHNINQNFEGTSDQGDPGGADIINVFTRDFSRQIFRFKDFTGFEWLPDGRLLLSALNELWIASANFDSVKKISTYSDSINHLAVSRDGQRLAFNMVGNIWTVNISGSGVNVTTSPPVRLTDSARVLGKPEFSPDGKAILVNSADSPNQAWAVPSDAQRVAIMNLGVISTSAFAIKSVEQGAERLINPGTSVWWR
jgi:WD40 repeat protein